MHGFMMKESRKYYFLEIEQLLNVDLLYNLHSSISEVLWICVADLCEVFHVVNHSQDSTVMEFESQEG